uniref:Ig-like domain-containing protein n=1 Tax=Xiphophorus maculatus TaxID=8083 RepID=A0A3B5QJH3_XIPMA
MVFGNCYKNTKIQVQIEGVTLDRLYVNKFLSVIIDDKVSWKYHIKHLQNKLTVPGQSVSLPCRLPNIKPAVVVQWTRPDLEPEYVLLFRDEQPDPENQHPSFRKRVELQERRMKDGDVSLLLSNVTTSDSGKYECRSLCGGCG